ncbi:MAG TPA: hypothetical protein VMX35_14320 [Acidobacteriota bacterium]|nr:hypothetical protein [Acidobacteriota bacterium]
MAGKTIRNVKTKAGVFTEHKSKSIPVARLVRLQWLFIQAERLFPPQLKVVFLLSYIDYELILRIF